MSNIPKLTSYNDSSLSVISPKDVAKNALKLDIDVAIARANKVKRDSYSMRCNCTSEGCSVGEDISTLTKCYEGSNKEVSMLVFSEFWNSSYYAQV